MANWYSQIDITKDPLYVEGYNAGYRQAYLDGCIKRFFLYTDCDDNRIAFLLSVPVKLVVKIRKEFSKQKLSSNQVQTTELS